MVPLHVTKPKLEIKLEKIYEPTSKDNPPASTYATITLHVAVESSTPSMTTTPNPAQPKS